MELNALTYNKPGYELKTLGVLVSSDGDNILTSMFDRVRLTII